MKINEVMIPNVIAINQKTSVAELVKTFIKYRVDTMPVVDAQNNLIGKISIEELITIFFPRYYEIVKDYTYIEDFGLLENVFIAQSELINDEKLFLTCDLMNTKVVSANEEESILHGVSLMKAYGLSRLPVINNDGKLVGIISHVDVILALLKKGFNS